jgi:murein L,D-transpeptidase YafK
MNLATRKMRLLLVAPLLVLAPLVPAEPGFVRSTYTAPAGARNELPQATRVVVRKAERKLELLQGTEVLRSYRIALGLQPTGHKERSGDFRTPEGSYRLTRRNARSDFFLSIQVSYPSDADVRKAKRNGWDPGGSIMIHGLPNRLKHDPAYYQQRDWTDGCIAVSNSDMVEIWLLTQNDIPIDILP